MHVQVIIFFTFSETEPQSLQQSSISIPGYFTESHVNTDQSENNLAISDINKAEKVDLNIIHDTIKDISDASYTQDFSQLKPDSLSKPTYCRENTKKK